jgi:hypothetical protein
MPHRTGWFPARRDDVIHLADAWSGQLDLHGTVWNVPAGRVSDFKASLAQAKTLLAEVKSGGRNPVNTEQCRLTFRELALAMQFIKANFFNSPPRTGDELAALLLSIHDATPTPIAPTDVVPGLSLHNTDGHGLLIRLFQDAAPADQRSADHFFGKWGLRACSKSGILALQTPKFYLAGSKRARKSGFLRSISRKNPQFEQALKPAGRWATAEEAAADPRLLTRPPTQAADLPMHFSTSRKRHELQFSLADIGLEAHVTACWQTPRNQEGPYCPIVARLIA